MINSATVAQWQCTCFVNRWLSVRLRPVARIFHSGNSIGRVPVFQTGCCGFDPRPLYFGRLAERLIALVLKTRVGKTTAGSNPAPSERPCSSMDRTGGFYPPNLGSTPSKVATCVNPDEDPDEDEEESDCFDPDDSKTWLHGPLAQWLEQSFHKGLVVGSNPTGPTTLVPIFQRIECWFPKPKMLVRFQLGAF